MFDDFKQKLKNLRADNYIKLNNKLDYEQCKLDKLVNTSEINDELAYLSQIKKVIILKKILLSKDDYDKLIIKVTDMLALCYGKAVFSGLVGDASVEDAKIVRFDSEDDNFMQ